MTVRAPVAGVVRTPTILQMEALESGAAALAMVLAHYGKWVPLEELRVLCGVSRDGSKAINLLKAARQLGLKAGGKRLEPADLATLPVPAILLVNMNHFVVFEGVTARGFQINDPAGGRRTLAPAECDRMFTGVALAFERTDAFMPGGKAPSLLAGIWDLVRQTRWPLALLAVAGSVMAVFGILLPGLQRVYLDRILIEQLDTWVWPLAIALAAIIPLFGLLALLQGGLMAAISAKLAVVLSSRLVWHVLRLPVVFFTQRSAGMISSRVAWADQMAVVLTQGLSQILTHLALLLLLALLMLQYSVPLTLVVVGLALINGVLFLRMRQALIEAWEKVNMHLVKMGGKAMQGLRMMETLKSTGTEDAFFSQWTGLQALFINAQQDILRREALLAAIQVFLISLSAAAVLVIGGYGTMSERFSIGMLVAFSTISILFNQTVAQLANQANQLQRIKGILPQVDDTLRYPCAHEFTQWGRVASDPGPRPAIGHSMTTPLQRLSGAVELEALTFGYAPLDPPLIEDFSLQMRPGSRVALVGPSGSGKSTVGKLVTGLLDPRSGRVLFDGRPMDKIPRETLRNSLAVVDQEIVLFEGSVRDNISLWDDTLPQEQLIRAAKDALIHDWILSRRGGYEARIEENGRNLSGGQRQRMEIARALAGDPTLLVLDEATSALDAVTEAAIMSNLRRRGCTTLIIAHRLSTIRDCDEIIVMNRGAILQRGPHSLLIASDGPYRRLLET